MRDFDRALTSEGRAQLDDIARALRRLKLAPHPLLSSPLVRARQTAEAVAPALGATVEIAEELQSGATLEAFLRLMRRYGGAEAIMFVGHEPDLSETAAALIGAGPNALTLKKAGLIRVDIDARLEPGRGRLRWLLTPHQLVLIGSAGAGGDQDNADQADPMDNASNERPST
jgi:phosphohistidine phosphatase